MNHHIEEFWDIMPSIPMKVKRRFGELQDGSAYCLLEVGFVLVLGRPHTNCVKTSIKT
jgi:hypothetical protein